MRKHLGPLVVEDDVLPDVVSDAVADRGGVARETDFGKIDLRTRGNHWHVQAEGSGVERLRVEVAIAGEVDEARERELEIGEQAGRKDVRHILTRGDVAAGVGDVAALGGRREYVRIAVYQTQLIGEERVPAGGGAGVEIEARHGLAVTIAVGRGHDEVLRDAG